MFLIPRLLFRGCLFGLFISLAGANVYLEIVDGKTSFDEGSDVQLLCTISPYNGSMTWFVDNVHYAGCLQNTCNPFPNKPYTFEYTFNESEGQFKLIIVSVNSSHANLLFACDDGNERKSVSFNVTPVNVGDGGWCKLWLLFLLLLIPIVIVIVICCCCCRKGYCYDRNCKDSLEIKIEELYDTGVDITWTDRSFCQCLSRYQINCKMEGDSPKPKSTRGTSFSFSGLQPSTEYTISLSATQLFCFETPYTSTHTQTLLAQPEKPNVRYEAHETEILLEWETPACRGNPPLKYLVKWINQRLPGFEEKEVTATNCNIDKLNPAEKYHIEVYAINNEQKSIPRINEIWTKSAQPEKPYVCHEARETEIFLVWGTPACRGNPPLKYLVKWGKEDRATRKSPTRAQRNKPEDENQDNLVLTALTTAHHGVSHLDHEKEVTTTYFNIDQLNPAEKYDIEVYAINNGQKSIPWKNTIWTMSAQSRNVLPPIK